MNPIPPACASAIAILGDETASMIALHNGSATCSGASPPTGCRTSGADSLTFAGVQSSPVRPGISRYSFSDRETSSRIRTCPPQKVTVSPDAAAMRPWPDVQPAGMTRPGNCKYGDAQFKTGARAPRAEPAPQDASDCLSHEDAAGKISRARRHAEDLQDRP